MSTDEKLVDMLVGSVENQYNWVRALKLCSEKTIEERYGR